MAQIKITVKRPSILTCWYYTPMQERNYIHESYPNLTYKRILSEDLLTVTRIRTGSYEDCLRFYKEFNDPNSIFKARKVYNKINGIIYTIELIE
jgi:hypothetical protein